MVINMGDPPLVRYLAMCFWFSPIWSLSVYVAIRFSRQLPIKRASITLPINTASTWILCFTLMFTWLHGWQAVSLLSSSYPHENPPGDGAYERQQAWIKSHRPIRPFLIAEIMVRTLLPEDIEPKCFFLMEEVCSHIDTNLPYLERSDAGGWEYKLMVSPPIATLAAGLSIPAFFWTNRKKT